MDGEPQCESPIKDAMSELWTGWFALEKGACPQSFAISRKWLMLKGAVPPWSASPRCYSLRTQEIKAMVHTVGGDGL